MARRSKRRYYGLLGFQYVSIGFPNHSNWVPGLFSFLWSMWRNSSPRKNPASANELCMMTLHLQWKNGLTTPMIGSKRPLGWSTRLCPTGIAAVLALPLQIRRATRNGNRSVVQQTISTFWGNSVQKKWPHQVFFSPPLWDLNLSTLKVAYCNVTEGGLFVAVRAITLIVPWKALWKPFHVVFCQSFILHYFVFPKIQNKNDRFEFWWINHALESWN